MHSWKFAADAVWEKALVIDAQQTIDLVKLQDWILGHAQNIAFEAIFAEGDEPATMFGVRVTYLPKSQQAKKIAAIVARTAEIQTETDFKKICAEIFPEHILFTNNLEALNIGIVAQWYSFKPYTIWKPSLAQPLTVAELQEQAPQFFAQTDNPAAIEFWYTQPIDHWYKIYVSDQKAGRYLINPDKYGAAIGRLPEFRA